MKKEQMTNEQRCIATLDVDTEARNALVEINLRFIKRTAYEMWSAQQELNAALEAKNLGSIIRLDEVVKDENSGKHEYIADPTEQTPEQIYLAQERIADIHHALDMIEPRVELYVRYHFGFDDDIEHPLTETAKHFHLSENRSRSTEALALDNVRLELPWWFH